MGKIIELGILTLAVVILAISIVNVVLNGLIYKKQRENDINDESSGNNQTTPTFSFTTTIPFTTTTEQSYSDNNFTEAAHYLLRGIDTSYDPCENFYMFSCGKYLSSTVIPDGASRIGTYDETQRTVNSAIAKRLNETGTFGSKTEKILQKIFNTCMNNSIPRQTQPTKAAQIYRIMKDNFNGFPMLETNWTLSAEMFWTGVGTLERNYGLPTLLQSAVTVDYKNISKNALYINQMVLNMARDYYVKPQFLDALNSYVDDMIETIKKFTEDLNQTNIDANITSETTYAANLETTLALATLADEELRNFQEQYRSFTLEELKMSYPAILWNEYLKKLIGREIKPTDSFIIVQPSYIGALNSYLLLDSTRKDYVNLLMIRLIIDNADFLSEDPTDAYKKVSIKVKKFNLQNDQWNDRAYGCVSITLDYMPYANGYTYLQTIPKIERDAIREDVKQQTEFVIDEFLNMIKTLQWLSGTSYDNALKKSKRLVKNYGWPDFYADFNNSTTLDDYHSNYNTINQWTEWFDILVALKMAFQITENFGLYDQPPNRNNFLMSPALVNAWYQPERNSITLPFAAFNPPYYKYGFPQAYNYAGQGGTAGHELTHGYDDEGVQFGPDGALEQCKWNHCSWMDQNSTSGFIDMAQCVVTQFSQHCCPMETGNVHCTSGERTQGENIADLGGQLAAYRAYRRYIKEIRNGQEEPRLPGLEQYTPNQIFWITYGYSWCMKYTDDSLIAQLLTNPHSPGVCRVNEVLRNIPEFAWDFSCKSGSYMYPKDDKRCHVWVR